MAENDRHNRYNSYFDDGDISCDCPSCTPILEFMGCESAVILENLGGVRGTANIGLGLMLTAIRREQSINMIVL